MSDLIDLDPVRRFVRMRTEIEQLTAQLQQLKEERDSLGDALAMRFSDVGISGLPLEVDGVGYSVHIARPVTVYKRSGVDTATLAVALRDCGLDEIVKETVNQQSLQSRVKEMLANEEKVPQSLLDLLDVRESVELRATRSSRSDSLSSQAARNL